MAANIANRKKGFADGRADTAPSFPVRAVRGFLPAAAIVIGLSLTGCERPMPQASGRHVDQARGYSIEFPEGWGIQSQDDAALICALSPRDGKDDPFSENITVLVETFDEPRTLDEYTERNRQTWLKEAKAFKEHESGQATLDGVQARWIIHSQEVEGMEQKILTYAVVRERRAYLILCNAQPGKFDEYRETFEKAVKSFRFE